MPKSFNLSVSFSHEATGRFRFRVISYVFDVRGSQTRSRHSGNRRRLRGGQTAARC